MNPEKLKYFKNNKAKQTFAIYPIMGVYAKVCFAYILVACNLKKNRNLKNKQWTY